MSERDTRPTLYDWFLLLFALLLTAAIITVDGKNRDQVRDLQRRIATLEQERR